MSVSLQPAEPSAASPGHRSPIIGFYGDDFTGSTDALAQFTRFGLRGILLLKALTENGLNPRFEGFDVVGIAGISRALPTSEMEAEVRPALLALAALDLLLVQYKVCSTFDSSADVGSIGRVLDLGIEMFGAVPVPVLAAQPGFGRYTLFGNHFANHRGTVYRLDRHPTMSVHPSTPIHEGDLRRVLAEQTQLDVDLLSILDIKTLANGAGTRDAGVLSLKAGARAVVIDALSNNDLVRAGELILSSSTGHAPRFIVGSGGLSYGLGRNLGTGREHVSPPLQQMKQIIAVSGSCSSQTSRQIDYAVDHGWTPVAVDPSRFAQAAEQSSALEEVTHQVLTALRRGASVVVHSSSRQHDRTQQTSRASGIPPLELVRHIGEFYGDLLDWILSETDVNRAIIAGGDTSGFTIRRLNAYGLEVEGLLAEAGSLCRLKSDNPRIDGFQVVLKGGQVGDDNFFELVRGAG